MSQNISKQTHEAVGHLERLICITLSDSRIEMGNGDICLRANEMTQSVDRRGIDETVAYPPGSLDIIGRRSVSHFNEYTDAHLSGTSATTSNAALMSSSHNSYTRGELGTVKSKDIERVHGEIETMVPVQDQYICETRQREVH